MSMIEISNLTYRYPNVHNAVLKDITMTIENGETVGIMGANGAGKSTLCYAVMGLVPHFYKGSYGGHVVLDGVEVRDSNLGEMVQHAAMVFQNPLNQFSGAKLTVEDEIAFGMENLGLSRETMRDRIEWVSTLLDIEKVLDRNPYQLSGGQMQRVALASVLALRPKVLILDEPTSQLDPAGTDDVFQAIRTLQEEGITTVIVEHKTELLVHYCDRLCIMKDGQVAVFDEPRNVFRRADADTWGVEAPRYTTAYKNIVPDEKDVPVTLEDTAERLKHRKRAKQERVQG
jgi:energy-coupling factor transport system ATP-binding protein